MDVKHMLKKSRSSCEAAVMVLTRMKMDAFLLFLLASEAAGAYEEPAVLRDSGHDKRQLRQVSSIQWKNCGPEDDPFRLLQLHFVPDVIHFPVDLKVSIGASLSRDAHGPIAVKLNVKRKVGPFWIGIPCKRGVGSCTLDDLCSFMPVLHSAVSTSTALKCPFKQGTYRQLNVPIHLPDTQISPWLASGEYSVQADLSSRGEHLGCVGVTLQLL